MSCFGRTWLLGEAQLQAFDILVDCGFLLIQHGIGEQTHIVFRVTQRQLEYRRRLITGHTFGRQQRRHPLLRVTGQLQHILQATIIE